MYVFLFYTVCRSVSESASLFPPVPFRFPLFPFFWGFLRLEVAVLGMRICVASKRRGWSEWRVTSSVKREADGVGSKSCSSE